MSKKTIKFYMSFLDDYNNLVEIPENIQKFIEFREEHWFKKFVKIEDKYKKQFEQCKQDAELIAQSNSGLAKMVTEKEHKLALTEKALNMAVENIFEEFGCSKYYNKTCNKGDNGKVCFQCLKEEYLKQAEEMMKSE